MERESLKQIVEAIIFVAQQPVKPSFVMEAFINYQNHPEQEENGAANGQVPKDYLPSKEDLESVLDELTDKYKDDIYPFEVRKVAEGYQFFTKKDFYPFVRQAVLNRNKKRLSKVSLETLAIIAYRQPITKAEMEFIRGVNCDYAVQKLLDKKLVSIVGRSDAPGRPLLYGTSPFFMQYFGLKDISDLPKLKEFESSAEEHLELFRQHQEEQGTPLEPIQISNTETEIEHEEDAEE